MLISSEIRSFRKYGNIREILKLFRSVSFDAYDFTFFRNERNPEGEPDRFIDADDYLEKARSLRAYADGLGIVCNQAHAPFPPIASGDEEYNKNMFRLISRSIEVAGILGAKCIVVHPCHDYSPEENAELFYNKLQPVAESAGVKIALENMWHWDGKRDIAVPAACSSPESFVSHADALDKRYFGACLDIGHAEMAGLGTSAAEMIRALGPRLIALHVHDNDRRHDNHMLPYTMKINFAEVISALKEVNYRGDITLEADAFLPRFPIGAYPEAARLMAKTADIIRREILSETAR
ncbi:MAG: sugar phosphate isomerase/epimerase [Clostridia bacterium]|nr:sugar phosphate isomerase/epimerase [Clostridia bacterium]